MKCLIVCFTLLVGALAYEWKDHELKCVEELGIDKSAIESIVANREEKPVDNQDYNEFIACNFKLQGWMKSDGSIDWDLISNLTLEAVKEELKSDNKQGNPEDIVKRILDPCRNIHGDSPGQTGVKTWNCIYVQHAAYRSEE